MRNNSSFYFPFLVRRLFYADQVLDSEDPVKDMYKKPFTFGVCKRFTTALTSLYYIMFGCLKLSLALQSQLEKQLVHKIIKRKNGK